MFRHSDAKQYGFEREILQPGFNPEDGIRRCTRMQPEGNPARPVSRLRQWLKARQATAEPHQHCLLFFARHQRQPAQCVQMPAARQIEGGSRPAGLFDFFRQPCEVSAPPRLGQPVDAPVVPQQRPVEPGMGFQRRVEGGQFFQQLSLAVRRRHPKRTLPERWIRLFLYRLPCSRCRTRPCRTGYRPAPRAVPER